MKHVIAVLTLFVFMLGGCGPKASLPPNISEMADTRSAAETFVFGPGDRIFVRVHKHQDLDAEIVIAPDGTITFPLVGHIEIAGLSFVEAVAIIEAGIHEYYTGASVSINIITVNNQKVYVVGEVLMPGVLQITGEMNVFEAVTRAGGINANAKTKNLLLIRQGAEGAELYMIDLERLLFGDNAQNPGMRAEDILVVPTKTIVNIERFFRHVQTIIGPFVNTSQVYRNLNLNQTDVIVDTPTTVEQ